MRCSICRKAIKPGKTFFKSGGKIYCGKKCIEKTLPRCAACKKPVKGGFRATGKTYCSKKCLSTTWPKCTGCGRRSSQGFTVGEKGKFFCARCGSKPRCFSCSMPSDCSRLTDGRKICPVCSGKAVSEQLQGKRIFEEVRKVMAEKFKITTDHEIDFSLVDSHELKRRSHQYRPGLEMGLFLYESTTERITTTKTSLLGGTTRETRDGETKESFSIFALTHIPIKRLREVISHELAHDWMQEHFPKIKDEKIREGWAEYIASRMNIVLGQAELNDRISSNPDKIYGDGYRMIKKLVDEKGHDELMRFFQRHNR